MKRSSLVFPTVAVAVAVLVLGLVRSAEAQESPVQFGATFETPSDFYDRFDYGYSGQNPWEWGNGSGEGQETHWMGDHNMDCAAPTTQREITMTGDQTTLDYGQLFWHSAPGGDPTKGHLMTAVNTTDYNIAWFSPKFTFTGITKVCWDINETDMSARKWTQVVFLDEADATRYPVTVGPEHPEGEMGPFRPYRAESGGYDLGYVSPEFSDIKGVTTSVISGGLDGQHQSLAGFKSSRGLTPEWFQDGEFTTPSWGATPDRVTGITDKATRYTHCLENQPNGIVRLTQATPNGTRQFDMPGQIPAETTRVVFQDDNYNPPKDEYYEAGVLTWHWDNIEISAASSAERVAAPAQPAPPATASDTPADGTDAAAVEAAAGPTAASSGDDGLGLLVLLSCGIVAIGGLALFILLRSGLFRRGGPGGPAAPAEGTP